jgi:hypothetical protein
VRLQDRGGVFSPRVDDEVGAEVLGELQFVVGDLDGGDGAAEDLRVLDSEVPEPADAGDRDQVAGADVADL